MVFKYVARTLKLSKAQLSRMIDFLGTNDLVKRVRDDKDDRRVANIVLTPHCRRFNGSVCGAT